MASRVSISASSISLQQDENKSLVGKTVITKKQPATRRPALGDISNVTNKAKVITKAGTGRVPIFGSSKPAVPSTSSSVSVSTSLLSTATSTSLSSIAPSTSASSSSSSSSSLISSLSSKSLALPSTSQFKPPASLKDNNLPPAKVYVSLHSSLPPTNISSITSSSSSVLSSSAFALALPPTVTVEHVPADAKPMDIDNDGTDDNVPEDIDIHDLHDPQCCTEYVQDIFEYCRQKELKDAVPSGYMSRQVDINEKMRGILIDWMVDVHVKFRLLTETMFLSVSLIDRFLAQKPVARSKLQLVGVTAMFVSAKYEEVYPPEVKDFVHITDGAYPLDEIFKMERLVLTTLDFNLSTPTPLHFLRRFSKAARSDSRTHTLSKYLTEVTLVEYKMLDYVPSLIAAASVYLARRMTNKTPSWTTTLEHYTNYSEKKLMDCAIALNNLVKKSEKTSLKAVRKKYSNTKLLEVAKIPAVEFL